MKKKLVVQRKVLLLQEFLGSFHPKAEYTAPREMESFKEFFL